LTFPWRYLEAHDDAILWRARDSEEIWVGLGSTFESSDPDQCLAQCSGIDDRELPFSPRCFGALAFDPARPMAGEWEAFSARRFWIPQVLLRWRGELVEGIVSGDRDVQAFPDMPLPDYIVGFEESLQFTGESWERAVNTIRELIGEGTLQKAVLARRYDISTDHAKQPARVLKRLHQRHSNCYLIGYRQNSSDLFFSITPERLFRIANREIDVDSLAGTDKVTDEYLRQVTKTRYPLIDSVKDREEQQIVTDFIRARLAMLCENIHTSGEPVIRKFGNIVHLLTNLGGELKPSTTLNRIIDTLHPTSAVCGEPTDSAKQLIARLEPDARGLYAGTIGMFDETAAEFAVAIRSGLVHEDTYSMYVGAGIVRASEAEAESRECHAKLIETLRSLL
jgi:menaquinone-specific isochorismate synthase